MLRQIAPRASLWLAIEQAQREQDIECGHRGVVRIGDGQVDAN